MRLDTDMVLANHHATLHFWSWCALGELRCAAQAISNPALEPQAMAAIAEVCRLLDDIEAASERNGCPLRGPREVISSQNLTDTAEPHSVVLDPTRAADGLEWQAWTSLGEGLEAVFADYRKRSSG